MHNRVRACVRCVCARKTSIRAHRFEKHARSFDERGRQRGRDGECLICQRAAELMGKRLFLRRACSQGHTGAHGDAHRLHPLPRVRVVARVRVCLRALGENAGTWGGRYEPRRSAAWGPGDRPVDRPGLSLSLSLSLTHTYTQSHAGRSAPRPGSPTGQT